jgi:2-hydroxychromene-2-carboxylate isomerase
MSRRGSTKSGDNIVGELISLAERRAARQHGCEPRHRMPGAPRRATFYFDLSSPFTYLAVERVERLFPGLRWHPAPAEAVHGSEWSDHRVRSAIERAAEERARALRMPLVWPERLPGDTRAAMRVAVLAARQGRGGAFALAASRLAFCGGFDLSEPDVLAEAVVAANLGLPECLEAACDASIDAELEATALRLRTAGATALPAVRVGRSLFCGEARVPDAAAAARAPDFARLPHAG